MKTLTLHELTGWYFRASVDGGNYFELGYFDVEDYMEENGIGNLIDESGDYEGGI